MLKLLISWLVTIAAGALAVPIADWTLHRMTSLDGAAGSPLVLADAPLVAVSTAIVAAIAFGLLALGAGRLTNRIVGLFVYGLGWIFVTYRSMPLDAVVRLVDEMDLGFQRTFLLLAMEMAFWTAPTLLVAVGLHRFAARHEDEAIEKADHAGLLAPISILGAAAATAGCLGLGWLFMRTDLIGQAVFGFAAATAVAVMVVRLIWPRANALTLVAAPLLAGAIGHVLAAFIMGDRALALVTAGDAWALARAMPAVYAGSGAMGVALGVWLGRMFGPEGQAEARHAVTHATPTAAARG